MSFLFCGLKKKSYFCFMTTTKQHKEINRRDSIYEPKDNSRGGGRSFGFFTSILFYKGGDLEISTINKTSKILVGATRLYKKISTPKFHAMSNLTTRTVNDESQLGGYNVSIQENESSDFTTYQSEGTTNGNLARLWELKFAF